MKRLNIAKIMSLVLVTVLLVSISMPCFADEITTATVYSNDGDSYIEYLARESRFHVVNVDPADIIDAFDSCESFTVVETDTSENEYSVRALGSTFSRTYQYTVYVTGIYGENVPIIWTVVMTMSQMNINGTNYDYFVDVYVGPTSSLMSNSYNLASGTSNVAYNISANGSTLNLTQIIQLEYASSTSIDVSANALWLSVGGSVSDTYYYRSYPQTCSRTTVLPIYNAIY